MWGNDVTDQELLRACDSVVAEQNDEDDAISDFLGENE
jgi:hypothetical protein